MGTNYYVETKAPCPCCGAGGEQAHIGKSSVEWEFLFQTYPEKGIRTFAGWKAFLAGRKIVDEYGQAVALNDLIALAEKKRGGWNSRTAPASAWGPGRRDGEWFDPEGFRFTDREFA